MYKFLKLFTQLVAVYAPILYWTANVETMTVGEGTIGVLIGISIALLIEFVTDLIKVKK